MGGIGVKRHYLHHITSAWKGLLAASSSVPPVPPPLFSADPLIGKTFDMAFVFEGDFFVGDVTVASSDGDNYLLKFEKDGKEEEYLMEKEMVRRFAPAASPPVPPTFAYSKDEGGELLYNLINKLSASKLLSSDHLNVAEVFETVRATGPVLFAGLPTFDPAAGMPTELETFVRAQIKALKPKLETAEMRGKMFLTSSAENLGSAIKDALAVLVTTDSTVRELSDELMKKAATAADWDE